MDVSINQKGTQVAILSSTPQDGEFFTELMLCEPGKSKADTKETIEESLGWRCSFTSDGNIAVLHEKGILYLSDDGEELSSYSFAGKTPAAVDISEDGVSLCLTSDGAFEEKKVIVFDKNGKMLYNESVSQTVQQLVRYDTVLFWMHADGVTCLNAENGQITDHSCVTENRVLLARGKDQILLCSPQKAEFISLTV